jgi:hypothetical protein
LCGSAAKGETVRVGVGGLRGGLEDCDTEASLNCFCGFVQDGLGCFGSLGGLEVPVGQVCLALAGGSVGSAVGGNTIGRPLLCCGEWGEDRLGGREEFPRDMSHC